MGNLIQKRINGYELLERIGTGGFGAVYKAYQSSIRREVAMKFILPGFANQPEFIRRFEIEAHVIARLEHPYIVPLYDYWRDPEGAYLVMRWLPGGSLRDRLKQEGALTVDEAHTMLTHICSGLKLAHRHDVIHRDIKPGNILLDEDGNAFVADFGIAKNLNSYDTNHTGLDEIVGSLDYLSPEQARSEAVSPATDVYSLGVMLFEMLAGQHPFHGASTVELLYKHINDPLPELTVLDLTIRDAVNKVIQKATQKNPLDRYQDVLSFAGDFCKAINATDHLANSLTQREYDVLHRIVDGLSNKEIADELFITISTVKTYITSIYKKLGVRSRVQAQLRAHELNLLEAGVGHEIPSLTSSYLPEPENPYKGLQAFEAHDHRDFFGREQLIDKLIKKMQDGHDYERFLAVIGPSGSGKSSLVKAGLIPAIWNGNIPGSDRWFTLDMMPGDHPMEELEVALTRISANPVADLNEHLWRDERGLIRASKLILPSDNTQLLIVIDQFEELFTHVDSEEERQHFLDILYTAITDSRSRIRVIITLRADFYDRPLYYPDFGDLVLSRMETILPLSAKELQRAIQKPAERVAVVFEEGLVAQIVSDVNYQSGALPLLQYALTELFEHRRGRLLTQDAYLAIGGVIGALTQRAEKLFAELDEDAQQMTRIMFLRLVTPGEGTGDTRRRVPRSELLAISEVPGLMNDLIDLFADHRMLSLDHDLVSRTPTVEVAHESILAQWERLRTWINQNREEIKMQQQISRMTEEWEHANRDPGYLARGLRLDHMLDWAEHSDLPLTDKEREFLATSLHDGQQRKQVEEARKAREITLEKQSVQRLRLMAGTFVIATIISLIFAATALHQRQIAINRANESRSLYLINEAQDAFYSGDNGLALLLAAEVVSINYEDNPDIVESVIEEVVQENLAIRRFEGHTGEVTVVAFSPDGTKAVSGSEDDSLILWDIATGTLIHRFIGHTGNIRDLAFSPDGQYLASASASYAQSDAGSPENSLLLWDVNSGEIVQRFEDHHSFVTAVAFSPDGTTVISGSCATVTMGICQEGELIIHDLASGTILSRIVAHTGFLRSIAISHDGHSMLTASRGEVIYWDISEQTVVERSRMFTEYTGFQEVAFTPGERFMLAMLGDGRIIRYAPDVDFTRTYNTGAYLLQITGGANEADVSDRFMVHANTAIESVRFRTAQDVMQSSIHEAGINALAISPDFDLLLSGSSDGTLILWDLAAAHPRHDVTTNVDISWIRENRYLRGFTCEERETYRIEPYCTDR